MRAIDGSATDVERRTNPLVNSEGQTADGRANNIYDGIDGADFVEVNFLHVGVVNLGFGLAQGLEDGKSALLRRGRNVSVANNLLDFL